MYSRRLIYRYALSKAGVVGVKQSHRSAHTICVFRKPFQGELFFYTMAGTGR